MCLSRKALLIACDPYNKLTGISSDLLGWYQWLVNNVYSGGWDRYEIEIISYENATVNNLRRIIQKEDSDNDYLFIAFSGHGCIFSGNQNNNIGNTIIQLHDGYFEENELCNLNSRCQRKTIYLDCCRQIVKLPGKGGRLAARLTEKDIAKLMFSWLLSISLPGIVKIHSASINENASDNPSFTETLLSEALKLMNSFKYMDILSFSTYDVFNKAQSEYSNNAQHPEYIQELGGNQFPFIVNPYIKYDEIIKWWSSPQLCWGD